MKITKVTVDLFVILWVVIAIILTAKGLVSWWVVLLIFLSTCHFKIIIGDK